MSTFSDNLKKARFTKGLNQEELANILGIKQASISQFETGDRIPTPANLQKIAEVLGTSVEELTGDQNAVIGQTQLMRKVKGLSPDSIDHLSKVADYLRNQEKLDK